MLEPGCQNDRHLVAVRPRLDRELIREAVEVIYGVERGHVALVRNPRGSGGRQPAFLGVGWAGRIKSIDFDKVVWLLHDNARARKLVALGWLALTDEPHPKASVIELFIDHVHRGDVRGVGVPDRDRLACVGRGVGWIEASSPFRWGTVLKERAQYAEIRIIHIRLVFIACDEQIAAQLCPASRTSPLAKKPNP